MGLGILGPPELVVAGRSVGLGAPRTRVVLCVLALNPNRVTPLEQLIDAVWDIAPPATARGQIQTCVSDLRQLFAGAGGVAAIVTRPPGYVLEIAPAHLDAAEFDRLTKLALAQSGGGQDVAAARSLRAALALWRGPALAGVDSAVVRRAAAVLDERRLTAVEDRVRLDLALGRHEELCVELRSLVAEHPLRERLSEFLMLALYRSGRQVEALEVGRRVRATLVEELGVEPGPEIQELQRAILNRDPALDLAPPGVPVAPPGVPVARPERAATDHPVASAVVPRQLPASIADFTDRAKHIDSIRQLLSVERDRPAAFAMPIVAISGGGGVGKTSLAIRVAHELAETFADGQLYASLPAGDGDGATASVLAGFLRAVGVAGQMVPDDLQERAAMYRSRLAGRRVLVVLDGVTSEDQVHPLLPGSPQCAVILTSRARLGGVPGAAQFDLEVFEVNQSLELLAAIVGRQRVESERGPATELVRFCDGLPLALRIAGARLASRPHRRINDLVGRLADEARRLDELTYHGLELRSTLALIYQGLSERAQRLFRLAALVRAPDFPVWTAAALLDCDLSEAEETLESLVDAQLLTAVTSADGGQPRYRFHEVIRVYAAERLASATDSAAREAALIRLLGGWLALAEQAHRDEFGGDYTTLHGDAPRWPQAGPQQAVTTGRPYDWLERERASLVAAVGQAADAGLDEMCWDLALILVTLFEVMGYFDDWQETSRLALRATERAGNTLGHAAMLYSVGTLRMNQKRLADADELLTSALREFRALGNSHGAGLALRNLAFVDDLRGDHVAMVAKYSEALALLRAVGDRAAEAFVLRGLATFEIRHGDPNRARQLLTEALDIITRIGGIRGQAQILHRFAELHVRTGELDRARQAQHHVLRIVSEIGDRIGEAYALYGLGRIDLHEGRLREARTTLRRALSTAELLGERLVEAQTRDALGEIAEATGHPQDATAHRERARQIFDEIGSSGR